MIQVAKQPTWMANPEVRDSGFGATIAGLTAVSMRATTPCGQQFMQIVNTGARS
jgi:hypothetical protein